MTFNDFGFIPPLMEAVLDMGYSNPTPIQQKVIPVILNKKDVLGCAQTGSGKTAAYTLPLLQRIIEDDLVGKGVAAIIIVPTRELAAQIDTAVQGFAFHTSVGIASIYGGGESSEWERQKKALVSGAEIIIATPGRLISHLNMGYVDLSTIRFLILDEADKMLDMGFKDDILSIIKNMPLARQSLLFSATMPSDIRGFALKILNKPEEIVIELSQTPKGILEVAYVIYENQKNQLLRELFHNKQLKSVLIFSATKKKAHEIAVALKGISMTVAEIHSDLEQQKREEVMLGFRNRVIQVLVATDVLSRGIDVLGIDLVVNYDVPRDPDDYIHRVGRTARAESDGVAITLVSEHDFDKFNRIERSLKREVMRIPLPPSIGEGPTGNAPGKHRGQQSNYKGRSNSQRPHSNSPRRPRKMDDN